MHVKTSGENLVILPSSALDDQELLRFMKGSEVKITKIVSVSEDVERGEWTLHRSNCEQSIVVKITDAHCHRPGLIREIGICFRSFVPNRVFLYLGGLHEGSLALVLLPIHKPSSD